MPDRDPVPLCPASSVSAGERPPRLPSASDPSSEALERRRALLEGAGISTRRLAGEGAEVETEALAGRIEGFVGHARVPVGVVGPLRIRGTAARGDFFVPLATTEGALLMSYQHVANMLARGEGIRVRCTDAVVWRAPVFVFASLEEASRFVGDLEGWRPRLEEVVAAGSRFCRLTDVEPLIVGRSVYLRLGFQTGDAAGQNMVTAATQAICNALLDGMHGKPQHWQIEANESGDKKATAMALLRARGRRASAEVVLSDKLCRRYFRAGAATMEHAWRLTTVGSTMSGALGTQGNYANALAALFIACGQDVACVAEAANGITTFEVLAKGELYASATLPNLIVGTVGGGTSLPTARESLEMLDCLGDGRGAAFAEVCAAVALVGEVALTGAMAGGSFARAHTDGGRRSTDGEG